MVDVNIKVSALEKLVDYAASGIGAVAGSMLAPWMAKQQVKAKSIEVKGQADRLRLIAQAQADARQALVAPNDTTTDRSGNRCGPDQEGRIHARDAGRVGGPLAPALRLAQSLAARQTDPETPTPPFFLVERGPLSLVTHADRLPNKTAD